MQQQLLWNKNKSYDNGLSREHGNKLLFAVVIVFLGELEDVSWWNKLYKVCELFTSNFHSGATSEINFIRCILMKLLLLSNATDKLFYNIFTNCWC